MELFVIRGIGPVFPYILDTHFCFHPILLLLQAQAALLYTVLMNWPSLKLDSKGVFAMVFF